MVTTASIRDEVNTRPYAWYSLALLTIVSLLNYGIGSPICCLFAAILLWRGSRRMEQSQLAAETRMNAEKTYEQAY